MYYVNIKKFSVFFFFYPNCELCIEFCCVLGLKEVSVNLTEKVLVIFWLSDIFIYIKKVRKSENDFQMPLMMIFFILLLSQTFVKIKQTMKIKWIKK